ncbi:hypothetical protein DEJ23_14065 [Curtobacterium sp. MCSS17_008]|uniref:S26 family signal peptidase n=1 Tax=Curtobacterium sp. MCSS17_008 TaxID=2175647 RepID=UPI000DA94E66|nr:S26 family signal peptidase [Curtobacterium sp. MCSS17_008]PZF53891.1 hypothetical protein DEJ23_14065 [Curtobacterium sp. MCSS17_008]
MVSITATGHPATRDAVRDGLDWGRVAVATLARSIIVTLLGLALWAAAPAVIDWQPTTVMTGSMQPRLAPGDVVVSRPVAASEIRLGQILLADDPDQAGHLRMHRYIDDDAGGTLITKGDANPQQDSTTITRDAVHGVAFLRVPMIGTPILWLHAGNWSAIALLAASLAAVLYLCTIDGPLRRLSAAPDGQANTNAEAPAELPARAHNGTSEQRVNGARHAFTRRFTRRRARRIRRLRRAGGAIGVLLLAGTITAIPVNAFADPFHHVAKSPTSHFTAGSAPSATNVMCVNNNGSVVLSWKYPAGADIPKSFSVLENGSAVIATTSSGTAHTATVKLSGLLDLGTVRTLTIRTDYAGAWTATSTNSVNVKVVSVLGLITGTACA